MDKIYGIETAEEYDHEPTAEEIENKRHFDDVTLPAMIEKDNERRQEMYTPICKRCGAGGTYKAGTRAYITGKYQMHRCKECGHQFKGEKIETEAKS